MSSFARLARDPFPNENRALAWTAKTLCSSTGADLRTRTADPILTMDVLYLLS